MLPQYCKKMPNGKKVPLEAPDVFNTEAWKEVANSIKNITYLKEPATSQPGLTIHNCVLKLPRLKLAPASECAAITSGLVATVRSFIHINFPMIACQVISFWGNAKPHIASFGEDKKTLIVRDGNTWYKADSANVLAIVPDQSGVTVVLFDSDGENREELLKFHIDKLKPRPVLS